jgi:hypothetical protein
MLCDDDFLKISHLRFSRTRDVHGSEIAAFLASVLTLSVYSKLGVAIYTMIAAAETKNGGYRKYSALVQHN